MKRHAWVAASFAALGLVAISSRTQAQTTADFTQTAAYAAAHQNPDGGFAASPGQPSTLGATNSALRILKHVGGSVSNAIGCVRFVKSCKLPGGGFAQTPGGKPDVVTTAIGLLAASELRIADKPMIDDAIAYFSANAKAFEEVRMSIAGLEAVETKSPDFARWAEQIEKLRRPDGSFGEGPGRAFATGGAAASILRMGMKLEKRGEVIAAIKEGQRPDGGWSKDDGPSDLASTYRVMRALYMLKEKPDVDRLNGFIARCRQSDGGYATTPGGAGSLSGTYFATIVIRWLRLLDGERPVVETAGFTPLFNGKDLTGWNGDRTLWSARDGMLLGKSPGLKHNTFLATTRSYRDFILSLSFRLVDGQGNSGVQFRSVRVPGHEMSGYQADIGEGYWGSLYDESRRNKVLVQASANSLKALRKNDWNHYVVRAMGNQISLYLNGVPSAQYREAEPGIAADGLIAVQIHAGGPMEIQFKDIAIQELPTPTADKPDSPGFHVRTLKTGDGERRYTVYVPEGYDGTKSYPAVLFLHGAGERGEDGITPAQVGLGPAILHRSGGIPALVVFPQARKTWAADSDDIAAALKALDDVMASYKVDASKVVLTGLSMGGMGSWGLAAAHPERFAAVVPICGPGRVEDISKVKHLPIRGYVGDADFERLHLGMRSMIEALLAAGAKPGYTEYRGVGHNSWDRAYNDPELIDWMLSQKRP